MRTHDSVERTAWGTVLVLSLFYVFAMADRQIFGLLAESIKHDLRVDDLKLSLLLGASFAFFFSLCALPSGWLVDRFVRRNLVLSGALIWGLATCGCAFASSYWQLFACRMAIGLGEAVLAPAAYSMISDALASRQLGVGVSVYTSAAFVGYFAAFAIGGLVLKELSSAAPPAWASWGPERPWQKVFLLAGLPCLICVPLLLAIREPARRGLIGKGGVAAGRPAVLPFLVQHWRAWLTILIVFSAMNVIMNGTVLWLPTYFKRTFHWPPNQLGLALAIISLAGIPGQLLTGWLIDRCNVRGDGACDFWVFTGNLLVGAPLLIVALMSGDALVALVLASSFYFFLVPFQGVAATIIQRTTPNEFRGQLTALYLFVTNAVGFGTGPTLVALISRHIVHDEVRLGPSIALLVFCASLLAVITMLIGLGTLRVAVAHTKNWRVS
jgi:MFS family permease